MQNYRALLRAAELGSLTKAAAELGYTQSGMSHIIRALEEEWRVKLLKRDRGGVRLTPEGELLLPGIRQVCKAQQDLEQQVNGIHGLEVGTVRIASISSVSAYLLPRMIQSFHLVYPNITFDLHHGGYTEVERWVAEDVVEFGFTQLPTRRELEGIELLRDQMMVVMGPAYAHMGEAFPIADMGDIPFIYHYHQSGGLDMLQQRLQEAGVRLDIRFTAQDDYSLMSMVECNLGISILSELFLYRIPYRLSARELDPPILRTIGMVMKQKSRLSLAAGSFVEHVQKELPKLWPRQPL